MKKECPLTCGTCKKLDQYLDNDYEKKSKIRKKAKIKKEKIGTGKYLILVLFKGWSMPSAINGSKTLGHSSV